MRYLYAKLAGFPQSYSHFPQRGGWMGKSGEKWWKMEGNIWELGDGLVDRNQVKN